jgi:ferrous iron transport protein B
MAARTMENRRDRFVTILVAPLMSCSARLPVYILLIGAFIPEGWQQGVTFFGMYAFSVVVALAAAAVLRRTLFRGGPSLPFILELPSYKMPSPKHVARTVFDRGLVFVKQAGTVILAISIVLWALAYFPRSESVAKEAKARIERGEPEERVEQWRAAAQAEQSIAGRLGKGIEPAIEPLGFDWKIGVGLIASFAAREVLVSTLGIIYSVGEADETSVELKDKLRGERRADGTRKFNWLSAISLMVFFVLACQCMSTVAVVKRETNSWRWPLFMVGYMTVLAYLGSLAVFQIGSALGWGP